MCVRGGEKGEETAYPRSCGRTDKWETQGR